MSLKDTIVSDLTSAMKSKDAGKLSTLRMVKANLMNRQIEKGSDLTDDEIIKALQSLVKQRRDSIEQYENAGRSDLAEREAVEIEAIEVYLPALATSEEIETAVRAAIEETEASSIKDMGAVMRAVSGKLAGKAVDGKAVSDAVKSMLN